jgi:tetratricopeptide (TPR) repeat protein
VREFQRLGGGERIHCLIVDDGSGGATPAPCFPSALSERPWSSAAPGEPIAADARYSGDGKANARLKLIAGILGISYDKLVQRDHQRGYRRMAMTAAAAVLALAVLTTFTIITITSRRDAEAQRSHAEGLVEFMLGDLRTRLAPEGRLATLDAVGKEALDYYEAQDPATLDDDALARRARALQLIGQVYEERGRLDYALGVFRQAADSTAEMLARDEANPQRIFDHAQSVFGVGLIAWRRGRVNDAEAAFRAYMALAERLVAIDPANADWQAEIGYASSNLGTLLLSESRANEAAPRFEAALKVAQALARETPSSVALQYELGQSHAWLADARWHQGRLQAAIAEREAEVAIYQDILATDPRNGDARAGLLVAEHKLGGLSFSRGQLSLALSQLRRATALAHELLADDPDSAAVALNAALALADLGEALAYGGDADGANLAFEHSRDLATRLVERDPGVPRWQTALGRTLLLEAQWADGTPLDALRKIQGVVQRLDTLRPSPRPDRGTRELRAQCLLAASERHLELGDRARAEADWQGIVDIVRAVPALSGPRAEAMLATALQALDRADEAKPLLTGLDNIGYRDPQFAHLFSPTAGVEARGARDALRQAQPLSLTGRTRQ